METRKIALIIFLIGLIFLSLGVIVYVARQRSEINNLQTARLATPPAVPAKGNYPANVASGLVTKDGKLITEELIKTKIVEKQTAIKKKASAKQYTDADLIFLTAPRQTVINELKSGQ